MELYKSFFYIIAVFNIVVCNSHETKKVKATNITETEYALMTPKSEPTNSIEQNTTIDPVKDNNLDNRIYLKKNKIISETTDVCFTLPKGLPTVPNVHKNNDYERLVVYIYDFKLEGGIKKVIYIPEKHKQNVLPDMPYEDDDFMMDFDNMSDNGTINEIEILRVRNEVTTKRDEPVQYDTNNNGVADPHKILKSTMDQNYFNPINFPNNAGPSPTPDQFNVPNSDMNSNPFKSKFVSNKYIPNYPFPQPIKYENSVVDIELPNPVDTPSNPPRNHPNEGLGHVQPNIYNLQILQQPMLIKLLMESGVSLQSFGPSFNLENMLLVPVIERVISNGKQTFYLNSIGIATKNPLKVYTIVPIRNKIMLYEIHPHNSASRKSANNPIYYDAAYPYQPMYSNNILEGGANSQMPQTTQTRQTPQITQANQIPQMPQVNWIPQMSQVNPIPQMTRVNPNLQMVQVNPIPQNTQVTPIPEMARVNLIPQMPQVNPIPEMAQFNLIPQMAQVNPIPQMPRVNQINEIAQMEQTLPNSQMSEFPTQNTQKVEQPVLTSPRSGISDLFQIFNAPMRMFGGGSKGTTKTPIVPKMDTKRPRPCKECGKGDIHVVPRILGGNPAIVSGRPIRNRGRS